MKRLKSFFVFLLVVSMALALVAPIGNIQAVRFGDVANLPQGYWAIRGPYDEARTANDTTGITTHGEALINFWLKGQPAEQLAAQWTTNVVNHGYEINDLWTVSKKVAETYEAIKDYTNAIRVFRIALTFIDSYKALIPHIGGDPAGMDFSRQEILAKIAAWDVTIELYAEIETRNGVGDMSFCGAKHEPRTGVYYGETTGSDAEMSFDKKPSATIIYVHYEDEVMSERVSHDLWLNEDMYGYNRKDYSVIQIAWNFINEGLTLRNVLNDRAKITEAARYLGSLGLPILLRIGAEMNVWEHKAEPEEYKAAFRFIAGIMHENATNVAMVWSVNDVSAAGLTYDMFYPGEQYVDWVGVSMYMRKYFQGNPNTSASDAAIWGTGPYANPIKYINELVTKYGSRHPIMISETGIQLYNASNSEDVTNWALPRMRMLYSYIPVLFPQVKAIFYFNTNQPGGFRYDLSFSPTARNLYKQLTGSGYFLGKWQTEPTITYKKVGTAELPANAVTLLTYAPYFTMDDISVEYRLDGRWITQVSDIPYRHTLNLSNETNGTHALEVRVLSGGSVLKSASYNILKSGNTVVVSTGAITPPPPPPPPLTVPPSAQPMYIDGKLFQFDAYLINNQNYVKLRDFAYAIKDSEKRFSASFTVDPVTDIITAFLTKGGVYEPNGTEMLPGDGLPKAAVQASDRMIFFVDGERAEIEAYMIGGSNYLRVRDMLELFDICASFDAATRTIVLDTTRPFSESTI